MEKSIIIDYEVRDLQTKMFIHTIKDNFLSEDDLLFVVKIKNLSVVIVFCCNFASQMRVLRNDYYFPFLEILVLVKNNYESSPRLIFL